MSDFDKFLSQTATSGLLSIMLSLGDRLKLFESLSKVGSESSPATAADVAKPLNLRPRYVQEWLCCMAAGDIVEVDSSGLKFWIKEDRVSTLCGDSIALSQQKLVPLFSTILPKVTETFKVEGPMGVNYDQYDNIHKVIDEMSRSQQNKHLIADVIPLTGMRDKLIEGGLNVLDIGCGNGCQVLTLAEHYPKCKFTAIDLSADALVHAEELGRQQGLTNVTFIRMNAQKLDDKWSDSFDLITNFDACHDQTRPDLSLKETHRVLKPNGSFAMLEMNGTGNVVTDKVEFGKTHATLGYALSTMACLQFGSQSEDALCLGTMWGRKKAVELLEGAGFGQVNVIDTPFLSTKVLYVCHKY